MTRDETTPASSGDDADPEAPTDRSGAVDSESDDVDWERRVADWAAGRRGATTSGSDASSSVPASYQPDPAVYDPPAPLDEAPARRWFALRRPGRPGASDPDSTRTDPDADASDPALHGVATWEPDDSAREAAMVVEPHDVVEPASDEPASDEPASDVSTSDEPASDKAEHPAAGVSAVTGLGARLGSFAGKLRNRRSDDDYEGPFLPPEPSQPPSTRPRPRPSADPSLAAAGAAGPSRPKPRPGPGAHDARPTAPAAASASTTRDEPAPPAEKKAPAEPAHATASEAATDTTKDPAKAKRRSWRAALRASRLRRRIVKYVIVIVVVAAAAVALRTYVVAPYYIPSQSMEPTLHGCPGCDNDHVLVDKFSYRFHDPHAGDIVVFDKPPGLDEPDSVLIKRVVAVGGERLTLKRGLVYVNGRRISEPYINKACPPRSSTPETSRSSWLIPNDDVFVMGDNRCDSTDSRTFGPIPDSLIVGRAFVIIWPLQRFTFL